MTIAHSASADSCSLTFISLSAMVVIVACAVSVLAVHDAVHQRACEDDQNRQHAGGDRFGHLLIAFFGQDAGAGTVQNPCAGTPSAALNLLDMF